ncbi:hypothetical protein DFJ43DRAFT_1140909 [Lentinula guzmanii]|uniref:Uncharacterized protein n=1 Tax=Lentinula guzmanii TaxID=2804957 RepID=A0AA38J6A8_9AGAR|nr:hypothetical protein DFJ43DRAFT_1140909 [Lentinula guzmanii]
MPSALELQLQSRREQQQQQLQTPRPVAFGQSQSQNIPPVHWQSSLFSDGLDGSADPRLTSTLNHSSSPAPQTWPDTPSHGSQIFNGAFGIGFDSSGSGGLTESSSSLARGLNVEPALNFSRAQTVSMDLSPAFMKNIRSTPNLTVEGKEALDNYLQAPTLSERLALHFTQNIITQSLLQQILDNRQASWDVSVSLKKVIAKYAKAYVLSSTAKFYIKCTPSPESGDPCAIGSWVFARTEDSALRASNVKDLPSEDEITSNSVLKSAVSRAITQAHAALKDQIIATTAHSPKQQLPAEVCDLGTLAQSVIAGSQVIPSSLALMYRLAVMRNVIDNENSSNARDFWPQVDTEMGNLLGVGKNPPKPEQDIISDFQLVYEMDIEKYGRPRVKPTNIGDPSYEWTRWVKTLNSLASRATVSESEGTGKANGGGKRKRKAKDVGGGRKRVTAAGAGSDEDEDPDDDDEQETNS